MELIMYRTILSLLLGTTLLGAQAFAMDFPNADELGDQKQKTIRCPDIDSFLSVQPGIGRFDPQQLIQLFVPHPCETPYESKFHCIMPKQTYRLFRNRRDAEPVEGDFVVHRVEWIQSPQIHEYVDTDMAAHVPYETIKFTWVCSGRDIVDSFKITTTLQASFIESLRINDQEQELLHAETAAFLSHEGTVEGNPEIQVTWRNLREL